MIGVAASACHPEPAQAARPLACPPCAECAAGAPRSAEHGPAAASPGEGPSAAGAAAPALATFTGRAAYYSDALAGRPTASGEPYDPRGLTAAHRELPFGTVVRVTAVEQGRSVEVRINDRGPFGDESRIIDLSRAAATQLGMIRAGVIPVRVEVLAYPPR